MQKRIKTSDVVWREDLYPRIKPDATKIQTYSENIEVLPPIELNQNYILIDGYHRWRAHQTAKLEELDVIITETSSEEQLLMLSIERNATHGLQLSNEDKRKYALRWWDIRPDDEICRVLSIAKRTFQKWTQSKREQRESEIQTEIWERWMRCETQQVIADALTISKQTVNDKITNLSEKRTGAEIGLFGNFEPKLYKLWNFGKSTNEIKHFGNVPPEILENLLYYYTEPFDVVYDPFAGGGMTIDVCKSRNRRYYVSDLTPIPARATEIRQWDITQGLPKDLPPPDLVFLDPPYWKQAQKKYSDKDTDLSNMALDDFLEQIGNIARDIKKKCSMKNKSTWLALIIGEYKEGSAIGESNADNVVIDLPLLCYTRITKYLTLHRRYQVPYSTEVHGGAFVNLAKKNKETLYLNRDLMVFKQ